MTTLMTFRRLWPDTEVTVKCLYNDEVWSLSYKLLGIVCFLSVCVCECGCIPGIGTLLPICSGLKKKNAVTAANQYASYVRNIVANTTEQTLVIKLFLKCFCLKNKMIVRMLFLKYICCWISMNSVVSAQEICQVLSGHCTCVGY